MTDQINWEIIARKWLSPDDPEPTFKRFEVEGTTPLQATREFARVHEGWEPISVTQNVW